MSLKSDLYNSVNRINIMFNFWENLKSKRDLVAYEQTNYDTLNDLSKTIKEGNLTTTEAKLIIEDVNGLWNSFEEEKKESLSV